MKKYHKTTCIALYIIVFLLFISATAAFAGPAEENNRGFFPERSYKGVAYVKIFNDYYILEGDLPSTEHTRRKLDACKIMYYPEYSEMSQVVFKTRDGGKVISQSLRRIILNDSNNLSPSGSYGIYC